MSEADAIRAIQWTGTNIAEMKAFDSRIDLGDDENTVAIDDSHEPLHLPIGCWAVLRADGTLLGLPDKQFRESFLTVDDSPVDAVQWTGDNGPECLEAFAGLKISADGKTLTIAQGDIGIAVGDWVVRQADGTLGRCEDAVFQEMFEPCDE